MESFDESNGPRSGVFPSLYEYPEDVEAEGSGPENLDSMIASEKPKIIIMGLRRSGKSSIQKVVFDKMSPSETLFLDSTSRPTTKEDISDNSIVSFSVWDFPGQIDMFEREADIENTFKNCGALIFVIDSQDDHNEALVNLNSTVRKAHAINPNINFEVFIHKVDGLSDDHKIETRQAIHQRANEDLADINEDNDVILLSFYLTSIYDHSIFEAFSKVVQKLIPQLPILENILNFFNSVSVVEKSFLFDVASKIFIATDSSPVDMQSYELCCDMIDVVMDISCIYGSNEKSKEASFDKNTASTIRLNSNTVLYLRQVNKFLALVCIIRSENFTMEGLIDYNFQCIREAIQSVFLNGKDPNRTLVSSNNIIQRMQLYSEEQMNGTDTDSLRDYSASSKPQEIGGIGGIGGISTGSIGDNQTSPILMSTPTSTPTSPQIATPKRTIENNNQNYSGKHGPSRAPVQRKHAIMPTAVTVSSLPNHQNNYVPFPASVDEGLTFRAKPRNFNDSH